MKGNETGTGSGRRIIGSKSSMRPRERRFLPWETWRTPRLSIDPLSGSDGAYATRGAVLASLFLKYLDIRPSRTRGSTLLDFGCGTGRVARSLSHLFKKIIAYDPFQESIEQAEREMKWGDNGPVGRIILTSDLNRIPGCSYSCCINVLEHLDDSQASMALGIIRRSIGDTGVLVLWYSAEKNRPVMERILTKSEMANDSELFSTGGKIQIRRLQGSRLKAFD